MRFAGPMTLPPLAAEDHECARCALRYPELTVPAAVALVRALPARLRAALDALPAGTPAVRPEPAVWSAVEYLCHIRDVYATYTIRLYRTRTEQAPALEPMLNDLRTVRFRYAELPPQPVLHELELNVAGFADEVARVTDWDRVASRLPGEVRTARWLVRQATHEGVHHLHDITAVAAAVACR